MRREDALGPRIVHLTQEAACSGAGRAALRIHLALKERGARSSLIVASRCGVLERLGEGETAWRRPIERIRLRGVSWLEARLGRIVRASGAGLFSLGLRGGYGAAADPRVRCADVVILYWVAGGFLSPEEMARIGRPLIWRLSDAWPFTGGCHYPGPCDRYRMACGTCPQLRVRGGWDPSRWVWRRKARGYRDLALTVVAPSRWIAGKARESALLGGFRLEVIPTGVDVKSFAPLSRQEREGLRRRLGVTEGAFVVAFVAGELGDPRKGLAHFVAGVERFARGWDAAALDVLLVGRGGERVAGLLRRSPFPVRVLGWVGRESELAAAYAIADLVVVPSEEDNLPNVILEAMSCGVPVAAAGTGGAREVVHDGRNGFLMSRADAHAVAQAIGRAYMARDGLAAMGHEARALVAESFDADALAGRWMRLCEEVASLSQGHGRAEEETAPA